MYLLNGNRYLVLFGPERDNAIYDWNEKNSITYSINHNFARIRIDSFNYLTMEKALTFHNVIILVKSVFDKNKNLYYYHIVLEKGLYKNKSYTQFFKMNVRIL